jgi:hypothetical protein
MAKLIKGDSVQNIITDGDVLVTSPSKIGKTLGEVLNEQQSDIDKLKSNVKYIYAYGGVGGSGSGGSGSTSDGNPSVFITLDGKDISNGTGNDIVLSNGKGTYEIYVKINKAGGRTYYMGYSTIGGVTDGMMRYKLNGDNLYQIKITENFNTNGTLYIGIIDDEGNQIGYYSQKYIVESDMFNLTLNYIDKNGEVRPYSSDNNKPYECFVDDPYRDKRHIKIDYSIFLLNYANVKIKCEIDGFKNPIYEDSDLSGSGSIEISMESDDPNVLPDITINNESILNDKYMGIYTVKASLSYIVSGEVIQKSRSFMFSVVPSGLYINVRTTGDVLYDDIGLLKDDISNGVNKSITQGSSLMMYCKVFEGDMSGNANKYTVHFHAYDMRVDEKGNPILDENDGYIWDDLNVDTDEVLTEQIESSRGTSVTFSSGGIKRIVISTTGMKGDNINITKEFEKFVFVDKFEESCAWYNEDMYNILGDSYFKANQGSDTYKSFPQLPSGNGVLSLTKSSNPIVLSQNDLDTPADTVLCTVISLGIQVSNINSENAKIIDVYTSTSETDATYSLKINELFGKNGENKIAIPTELLNKNENSKYHLVQIIRNITGYKNDVEPIYEDSLYIDGMLESAASSTVTWSSKITKFILNNINICYNLINVQYFNSTHNGIKFNPDAYAYQYWLAYKEKYVNSNLDGARLSDGELFIKANMNRMYFDGTNVIVEREMVKDIALRSDIATVVFSYTCENGESISEFMEDMLMGRPNGDKTFHSKKIDLYWFPEKSAGIHGNNFEDFKVEMPSGLTSYSSNEEISGNWEIDLQGTSTMRNRIKNYSLRINTKSSSGNDKILFSPNFNIENSKTFLPDVEWTVKADIADSAHANNTSIGKFVNDVCTKIDTQIGDITPEAKKFIKNTLEGIPVLLYFMCSVKDDNNNVVENKIYYFGIYNFNLGRKSYYNLGYTGGLVGSDGKRSDFMRTFNNIASKDPNKYLEHTTFSFAVGECVLNPNIVIGEIQENSPEFDFHQYHPTLLFKESDNNDNCMFGYQDKVTCTDFQIAKTALCDLVRDVAKAGKYCFIQSGREEDFVTSREFSGDINDPIFDAESKCMNRYAECKIPDPKWQIQYVNNKMIWDDTATDCDNVNITNLKDLISYYEKEDGSFNEPRLNYNSASEYYTICMAFGMVDSVLKNMNLKNFRSLQEGPNFYCSFYDMDCALEESNDGRENVSYLAATDYWYSPINDKNKVSKVVRQNDYWNNDVGAGFDFTSSYLFAVVKYARSIFESFPEYENILSSDLSNYPQRFWANLRKDGGFLQSADHFMKNYFRSGITSTFEYLASLNYRVKYLYRGKSFDSDGGYTEKYLANGAAFNGSRRIKAKNWLTKRLRFMDFMMNINNLTVPVSDKTTIKLPKPGADFMEDLMKNPDITILHSAFDGGENTALSNFAGEVAIYSPTYTPFIFAKGTSTAEAYLLPGGLDKPNLITIQTLKAEGTRFYGSGLFTSVNKVESMLTSYKSIISDNLEKITYGGTKVDGNDGVGLLINAKSVREIDLNIPKMGGLLNINEDCISLERLNIANTSFYGNFESFPNLQEVNISSINSSTESISVANSNFLTGERFYISGQDEKNKTNLTNLSIVGVTGKFSCRNTNIESIHITNNTDRKASNFDSSMLSEFEIYGDSRLKSLTLNGFRKVSIIGCNNLATLTIDDALEELYINLEKGKDEKKSHLNKIFLNKEDNSGVIAYDNDGNIIYDYDEDGNQYKLYDTSDGTGIFDFTNYPNLKKVTLINCDKLVHIKLPDHDIETDGMSNNINLKWIDTGKIPSFLDYDNDTNNDGYIKGKGNYEGWLFPIYTKGYKLILCSEGVFQNCPNYNMVRSDWDKGAEMLGDDYIYSIAYTNITVSDNCTSLANTFSMSGTSSNLPEDCKFNMDTAIRFIEVCVPDNVKKNITSLSRCFRGRTDVMYAMGDAASDYSYNVYSPKLSKYISLDDISGMYENTGVVFISKQLLSLPYEGNDIDNTLSWSSFISRMNMGINISKDALENISYRLESYSGIKFNIYEYDSSSSQYILAGNSDNMFDICEFFHHKKIDGVIIPYNITSINSLNFGNQYIDFRSMFNLFPNIETISNSINGNLSLYNIDGLLRPCKNIISITNSFNDDYINDSTQIIDLYNFFNWEDNTTDITNLFEGQTSNIFTNGFKVKKTIDYNNFKSILTKITEYTNLTRLTNIFSYCTITGYKDAENKEIKFEKSLDNIKNISFLFENCTSDYRPFVNADQGEKGIYTGGVLYIGRSFFENLPNFTIAQRTFANTYLSSPLTYDYFCKRDVDYNETQVLLSENRDDVAILHERSYRSNIINLKECFYNTKFVNCKNWFDHSSDVNVNIIGDRNYITKGDDVENKHSERGFVYYKYNIYGLCESYILDNDIFDDCLDNYTDYISNNEISSHIWYNHDLLQDFSYYGNLKDNIPFNLSNDSYNTIQKTYCCLPPDFLYGCSSTAIIDGIFANSNIVGVIPRNLTKKIKNQSIPNIFKNVNIMPNLEYYYDVKGGLDNSILDNIDNIVEIEDGQGDKYCVVFRDENGILKKRKPVTTDKNLGQFVYVPDNFTLNNSLMNTFNFRYNLPKHWNMPNKSNIGVDGYKTTKEFNDANLNLEYHTQYYFTTDKSVKWENVRDAKSVFIKNEHDIDFSNRIAMGKYREYCDKNIETDSNGKNTWTPGNNNLTTASNWFNSDIVEKFYIDLNLCGRKNKYSMIEDYGCPIVTKNREVYLDDFVSGILTIFLNGRVFYDDFMINELTTSNHKSSSGSFVIGYYGFGKNIILPKYNGIPLDDDFIFIPTNNTDVIYYDFMINDNEQQTIDNYKTFLDEKIKINVDKNKYTFK